MNNIQPSGFRKTRRRNQARRRFIFGAAAVALAVAVVVSVYAAFLSAGHRKGVAVANGYYFVSNVLSTMGSSNATPGSYTCIESGANTQLPIQIRNYDSKMQPDQFDVTYKLTYQLIDVNANDIYSYSLSYNGQTYPISTTAETIENFKLTGSVLDYDSFVLLFARAESTESNVAVSAKVRIIAEPTEPAAMSSYVIGSDIALSNTSAGFSYTAGFDADVVEPSADLSKYAGFIYHINTDGTIPDGKTEEITLKWDTSILEINKNIPEYSSITYTSVDDGSGNVTVTATLTLSVNSGESYNYSFYRSDGWTDAVVLANTITVSHVEKDSAGA